MKTLCAGYVRRTVCICIPVPVPRMSGSKALEPCRLCVHYRTKTIAEQGVKTFQDVSRRLFACGSKTALTMMNDRLSGKYRRQWAGHIARDKPMQLLHLWRMTARSTFPCKPHMALNRAYLRIGSSIGCCAQVAEKRVTRGTGLKFSATMTPCKRYNRRFRIQPQEMRTASERPQPLA